MPAHVHDVVLCAFIPIVRLPRDDAVVDVSVGASDYQRDGGHGIHDVLELVAMVSRRGARRDPPPGHANIPIIYLHGCQSDSFSLKNALQPAFKERDFRC